MMSPKPEILKIQNLIKPLSSKYFLIFLLLILVSIGMSACGLLPNPIEDAVNVLDEAISTLENESADWRSVLEETRDKLVDDGQSTIRNEVSNVMTRAVAATGAEFRCDVDFIRSRVRQDLIRLRADLLNEPIPEKEPALCNVNPLAVDVSLVPERLPYLEFYGYDFDFDAIQVLMVDENNYLDVTHHLSVPTHYHMTLDLGSNGVQITANSSQFILRWGGEDISSITISQPAPEEPELPACIWTDHVSDETPTRSCPSGYALKGINCDGMWCDNKELYCCPYHHEADNQDVTYWGAEFSEEGTHSSYINGGFVAGMGCRGDYCDNVKLQFLLTPKLTNVGQCSYRPRISEEGSAESICPEGYFGAGMACYGGYCDDVSLRCCRYRIE